MRKRIVRHGVQEVSSTDQHWLDVDRLAQVEITSEAAGHPIKSALLPDTRSGWQAATGGEQTMRLLFDTPMRLSRIRLVFDEEQHVRTQEFALRWSPDGGQSYQQLVPAVQFQSTGDDAGDGGLHSKPRRGDGTGIEHCPGHQRG